MSILKLTNGSNDKRSLRKEENRTLVAQKNERRRWTTFERGVLLSFPNRCALFLFSSLACTLSFSPAFSSTFPSTFSPSLSLFHCVPLSLFRNRSSRKKKALRTNKKSLETLTQPNLCLNVSVTLCCSFRYSVPNLNSGPIPLKSYFYWEATRSPRPNVSPPTLSSFHTEPTLNTWWILRLVVRAPDESRRAALKVEDRSVGTCSPLRFDFLPLVHLYLSRLQAKVVTSAFRHFWNVSVEALDRRLSYITWSTRVQCEVDTCVEEEEVIRRRRRYTYRRRSFLFLFLFLNDLMSVHLFF